MPLGDSPVNSLPINRLCVCVCALAIHWQFHSGYLALFDLDLYSASLSSLSGLYPLPNSVAARMAARCLSLSLGWVGQIPKGMDGWAFTLKPLSKSAGRA